MKGLDQNTFRRAVEMHQSGRLREADSLYEAVLLQAPRYAPAMQLGGLVLFQLGQIERGIARIRQALELDPNQPDAWSNLGGIYLSREQPEEALECLDRALLLNGNVPQALNNRGNALLALGRGLEAIGSYEEAIRQDPGFALASANLGVALLQTRRRGEAVQAFDAALRVAPDNAVALKHKAIALLELKQYSQATEAFDVLLRRFPADEYARGFRLLSKLSQCRWDKVAEEVAAIRAGMLDNERICVPLVCLAIADSAADQQRCARIFSRQVEAKWPHTRAGAPMRKARSGRIRVAYVSPDFRHHAVSYLLSGVWEQHDRERFETFAVSLHSGRDGEFPRRVRAAFDEFVDVSALGEKDIARRMRDLGIDIAIDLAGHTRHCRTGIFSLRAAPIQVNFLGFPGTMGARFIDYLIADDFVIPPDHRRFYDEQVVYLPDTFQPNDDRRIRPNLDMTRTQVDLPEDRFIWACLNNLHKLNPEMLDAWARILKEVPESVLWLLGDNDDARKHLRAEIGARGLDPQRVLFAKSIPYEEHLSRLALADVFLDTVPFNAGTTASDALWAGLPVLTLAGDSFAGRMAGSLLRAAGLTDLITPSFESYVMKAVELAEKPAYLNAIRARLRQAHSEGPLFDSARYCRHLETAYSVMMDRHERRLPPASFSVESDGRQIQNAEMFAKNV